MSKFKMKKNIRRKIEEKGLYALTTETQNRIPLIMIMVGIIILGGGIPYLLLGEPSNHDFMDDEFLFPAVLIGVFGLALLLLGICHSLIHKNKVTERLEGLQLLTDFYDLSSQEILKEITDEIRNTQSEISATESAGFFGMLLSGAGTPGYFTKNWYIAPDFKRFVKLTDIMTVVGIMEVGTFVVPNHGDIILDMFGGNPNWGKCWDLISQVNPHLLDLSHN